jgi:hypothetical protein
MEQASSSAAANPANSDSDPILQKLKLLEEKLSLLCTNDQLKLVEEKGSGSGFSAWNASFLVC